MAGRGRALTSEAGVAMLLGAVTAALGAVTAGAATPSAPAATVTISGEVRFQKQAPVFLQLLTLDPTTGKETVARSEVVRLAPADVARRSVRFSFADLLPGWYAVKSFQDENGNGKIDVGAFGPKEPWATYRAARPKLRPPRFEEMAFQASTDVTNADLVLR